MAESTNHDWLDKYIAEQKGIHAQQFGGDVNIVTDVSEGIAKFGDEFFDPC